MNIFNSLIFRELFQTMDSRRRLQIIYGQQLWKCNFLF